MNWHRASREIGELRERAYRRAIVSALRREETWNLADHYAPPSARMMLDRGTDGGRNGLDVNVLAQAYTNIEGSGVWSEGRRVPSVWVARRAADIAAEYDRLALAAATERSVKRRAEWWSERLDPNSVFRIATSTPRASHGAHGVGAPSVSVGRSYG